MLYFFVNRMEILVVASLLAKVGRQHYEQHTDFSSHQQTVYITRNGNIFSIKRDNN